MSHSLRGHFLVARDQVRDSCFFKTAILIIEHGPDGAMGLIVNRPSPVSVTEAVSGLIQLTDNSDSVYTGGPVEPSALFVVHDSEELDPTQSPIVSGVHIGASADVFEEILEAVNSEETPIQFRVYSGCAGWSPGQLEGEIDRGDWLSVPAQRSFVYTDDPYQVWDELLRHCMLARRILPVDCEHPEWN